MLAKWLRQAGWHVLEAADGAHGLKLALESKPELIFCDVHIPGCTGFQICRALRAPPVALPDTRFVITTSSDYEAHREATAQAGADDYLVKPFTEPEIQHFLRQVHRPGSVTEILRAVSGRRIRPADTGAMMEQIPSGSL